VDLKPRERKVPERGTLKMERRMTEGVVTVAQSDLPTLVARAIEVFGSRERAVKWLETTNPKVGGETPITAYLNFRSQLVEEELVAIEQGVVA
jgi:uncharacterized protein (DUF2384 family)